MVIVNEDVLSPEYVPDRLPGRDREIEEIASNLRRALDGGLPSNMVVHGPPGTGKTAVMKYILREMEGMRVLIVYINCWHAGTRSAILSEVARSLGLLIPPRGGSSDYVITRIVDRMKGKGMPVVVVLDEMDRLIATGNGDVLYDLTRLRETKGVNLSVVGIVNDYNLIVQLDPRIRSSFVERDVEFKPYTVPILKDILRERARLALEAWEDDAIGLCAAEAYKRGGDARLAITFLRNAARHAEREGRSRLIVDDVYAVLPREIKKVDKSEVSLDPLEREIVQFIRERGEVRSGEVYAHFRGRISERGMRNYIGRLVRNGILEAVETRGRGLTRLLRVRNYADKQE